MGKATSAIADSRNATQAKRRVQLCITGLDVCAESEMPSYVISSVRGFTEDVSLVQPCITPGAATFKFHAFLFCSNMIESATGRGLVSTQAVPEGVVIEALLIDNRGIGRSTSPKSKHCYSTVRMAMDALEVMVSHFIKQDVFFFMIK